MRVVLRSDLDNLGKRGDVVDVADGYGRNFLMPRKLAIPATPGIASQAASMRRSRDLKDARARESAEQIARKLVPMIIRIPAKAGANGKLFGSITATDVVHAVTDQAGVDLDRRRLVIEDPIRVLGTHELPVKLHPEVEFRITIEVEAQ